MYENLNGNGEANNIVNNGANGGINLGANNEVNAAGAGLGINLGLGGIGTQEEKNSASNIYKKIGVDTNLNIGEQAGTVKGVYGGVKLDNANGEEFGLPAKVTPWTKIKNFLFKDITITPYQKKVLGEVRDFWCQDIKIEFTPYQKKVFGEVRDFWCQDITNIFKRNKNKNKGNGTNL